MADDGLWKIDNGVKGKLIEWEDTKNPKAPLSEKQLNTINLLGDVLKYRPLDSDSGSESDSTFEDKRDIINNVDTVEQFLTLYSKIEDELLEEDNEQYKEYLKQLMEWQNETDGVLNEVDATLKDLEGLQLQYELVSHNTDSLRDACQQLLKDQEKLNESSEEIKKRLEFFTCLDSLQQRLNNPTLSVTSDTFFTVLNKLDDCIEYLNINSSYKASPTYTAKFKYCLSKALQQVKQYVMQSLVTAKNQVLQVMATYQNESTDKTDGSNFALFYGRFQAFAFKVKKVIYNIETRVEKCVEYENLLSDCHEVYLEQRRALMGESVQSSIVELSVRHKGDHCTLVRSGCAFLVHICTDEYQLFFQFFHKPTPLLTAYLEGLCLSLYDILRPIIIHVNHLETLAELCSILRLEMLEEHVQNTPLPLEAFSKVVWQLLQDVQERLVFRAHLYLQSDILNYKASAGDLAYPEKLEMMESIALSIQEQATMKRSESKSSLVSVASTTSQEVERINSSEQARSRTGNSPADLHGMWFPPVRRTLVTLSRLYRCVERPIFQGLSQEALAMCIESISQAAAAISLRSSVLDGKLFEMKHLLILREQVAPFQVDFTVKEMSLDFTKVRSAAYSLIQKRNRLFSLSSNNALLEFLLEGTPTVKEQTVDSRKEVDRQLKLCCQDFIAHASDMLVASLTTFLSKANTFIEMASEKKGVEAEVKLRNQPFASPEMIGAAVQEAQRQIKSKLSVIQRAMQLYLANKETELILYRPIKNNVANSFQGVHQLVTQNGYTEDDLLAIGLLTQEQVLMLLYNASLSAQQHSDIEPIMETSRPESTV